MKTFIAGVGGYVMGIGFGIFMAALEFREVDTNRNFRARTRDVLAKDFRKVKGTARGFATFGMAFALFECMLEHVIFYF